MKKNKTTEKEKSPKKDSSGWSEKKLVRRINIFFFILCFLVYGSSVKNNYSMDDEFVVRNNKQVQQGIKAIPEIFSTTYVVNNQKSNYEYRPVVKASFAIECQFFGANPHISHLLNVTLYALSIILLFFILRQLLRNYHLLFPFLITLLFLVHPLHSEVVISIKNRDVILSFIGGLLSLWFYLRYYESKKIYFLLFGSFFMLFGLMSKKDVMTFFAIIPFTLWFFRDISFKRLWPVFVSYIPVFMIFRFAARSVNQDFSRKVLEWENPLFFDTTIAQRIPTGFYTIYFYLKMFLLPHPLVSYYGYNQVPIGTWKQPLIWIMVILVGVLLYFIVRNWKTKKIWLYGAVFFLASVSMFTNIMVPVVGIVGERFAYIPSLGLCIIAIWALCKAFKLNIENKELRMPAFSSPMVLTIAAICLLFSIRSFARIKDWKDTYTLYLTDVKSAPESAHANSLIAAAAIQKIKEEPTMTIAEKRKQVDIAEKYYLESIRIIPDYISSLNNLGMIYFTYFNQPDKAATYLRKAVKLDPNYVEAYFNLAICEAKMKQYDVSEQHFLKTLQIDKDFVGTYFSLSNVYAEQKKYDEILKFNQNAIDQGVKLDILHINIGNVHFMRGDTLKALPYLEKGIELNPNNRRLNSFLANYYKDKGDLEKANKYYELMRLSTGK